MSRSLPRTVVVPAVCAAATLVTGSVSLGRRGAMGNDEVASYWAAQLPPHLLVRLLSHLDAVHGLYYLLLHGWISLVGAGPVLIRIPSLAAMALGVAAVADLTRRVTASTTAALAAGLVAVVTPSTSYYAQTARSYAFVYVCVVVLTSLLVRTLDRERTGSPVARDWAAYALLLALAGYLNEMALLVVAAHGTTVLLSRQWTGARHWSLAAAAGTVLVLPLLVVSLHQTGPLGFIARPGWDDVRSLWERYFGLSVPVAIGLSVLALVAVLPLVARRSRSASGSPLARAAVSAASVGLPLMILPGALLLGESALGSPLYEERYVMWGAAGASLLVGSGVARLSGRWRSRRAPLLRLSLAVGLGYPDEFRTVSDLALAVSPAQAGNFHGVEARLRTVRARILGRERV